MPKNAIHIDSRCSLAKRTQLAPIAVSSPNTLWLSSMLSSSR
uniref:Uncharacterized protein n=1 Tax=Arundo donax TaxID=35708 RepID=A0A0A9HFG2_ARUDO